MATDLLTDFQRLVLRAFFRQDGTEVFYLTGGAAEVFSGTLPGQDQ